MFERNLEDLIRGLRANKKTESIFIGTVISEIKEELKSTDFQKKCTAIAKLTYLQMVGVDISWASFNVIEVMTAQKFSQKKIGYLAACQSFHEGTEVITLATQLIRKDMTSPNVYDSGLAINCLANICTPDLARDLAADVVSLLNSSRPYIKKKACLVLYKIFLKFPDALRPSFPRLKEKLEDTDPAVVAAAVNVICELARKNPKNYISLAPLLFKILTATDRPANNWVLIKIVKLFAALLPIEQRLAKKLVQPLTNIMNTTSAMSLQYECIQTCTIGLSDHLPTIKLCISKLRSFVEDPDQNLKYLGLLALNNIMKIHPKAVAEHRDLVLNCLEDEDTSIRLRALDLLEGMGSKRNIVDIIRRLLENIEKTESAQYKDALVEKIVAICSKDNYQNIQDFEWYISVLMELSHISSTKHGELLAFQFLDVCIRVSVIRPFGVKNMLSLLRDTQLISENPKEGGPCEVLYSAGWIVGEFAPMVDDKLGAVEALLQPRVVHLPPHIQSIYMQASLKLFGNAASLGQAKSENGSANLLADELGESTPAPKQVSGPKYAKLNDIIKIMEARLPLFTQSQYLEVQERSCFTLEVLNLYNESLSAGSDIGAELFSLFDESLNPVAPKAQKKVKIPEGLDLDEWINEEPTDEYEDHNDDGGFSLDDSRQEGEGAGGKGFEFISSSASEDDFGRDSKKGRSHRDREEKKSSQPQKTGPYYLSGSTKAKTMSGDEDIQQVKLSSSDFPGMEQGESFNYKAKLRAGATSSSRSSRGSSSRKTKGVEASILKDEDIEGDDGEEEKKEEEDQETSALNKIDLRMPLGHDERLPVAQHRVTQNKKVEEKKKDKSSRRSKDDKSKSSSSRHSSSRSKDKDSKSSSSSSKSKDAGKLIDFDNNTSAYENVSSPPVDEKKKSSSSSSSSRSSKDKSSSSSSSSRRDDKKSSSSSSSSRSSRDKDRGRSHSSRDKDSKSSSSSSKSSLSSSSSSNNRQPAKFKPLCQDENLSVIYELRVSPKDGKKIMVALALKNLSSSEISDVEFKVPESMNFKLSGDSNSKATFVMKATETATFNMIFDCQSFQQAQRVPGTLTYNAVNGEEKSEKKKDFVLLIPSSSFILPIKLEKEQFITILKEGSFSLSQAEVKLEENLQSFVVSLAMLLHVELIFQEGGVSLYGKSVQGHQVAVYVKPSSGSNPTTASVQLKCSDEALGKSLINEVSNFFPRP